MSVIFFVWPTEARVSPDTLPTYRCAVHWMFILISSDYFIRIYLERRVQSDQDGSVILDRQFLQVIHVVRSLVCRRRGISVGSHQVYTKVRFAAGEGRRGVRSTHNATVLTSEAVVRGAPLALSEDVR